MVTDMATVNNDATSEAMKEANIVARELFNTKADNAPMM
jgi:hypothetical protein